MTKFGTIDFNDSIIDALRDDRLVIFAGAGVSMGPPSNLSNFWKLATDIAQGTGLEPTAPLDRFLGELHHRNVAVHERAARLLSPEESAPNSLHYDLLRLFRRGDCVRLVTTNFDSHFVTAANELYKAVPNVYRAPALPRGYDFTGIVHVHGAVPYARDLVLTDSDFGRAYLTEGWARRFLVDVFRRYTVLFVGYSHNDVVMNYLARALPADSVAGRYALTEEDESWNLLGITPIRFEKSKGTNPFGALYEGVQRLAERNMRGALDWQSRLSELGCRLPPTDEEAISEVEQALREVHTTRFLIDAMRDPEWIRWLNRRNHLDALFSNDKLSERDQILSNWLVQYFVIEHPEHMFELIASHQLRLNSALWMSVAREIGVELDKQLEVTALERWVSIMLASIPDNGADFTFLMWLAERCASQECVAMTLKVFMAMSEYRLSVKQGGVWNSGEMPERSQLDAECQLLVDHWSLNEIWTKQLQPRLSRVAQPLLSQVVLRFELMHAELTVWGKAAPEWDPMSYGRSAIEPHEQDHYPAAIDVLVDAARDVLEWFADNSPALLNAWIERLITSDVPLLRRLAIHALTVHPQWSQDDRLQWLLERVGLHNISEHHEIYRAIAMNYPDASEAVRKVVVDAILTHNLPSYDVWPAETRTAHSHLEWLSWLLQAKPDCEFAGEALAPIKALYPRWGQSEHPEFTHWMGPAEWIGTKSPWSIEQLLSREPIEQLNELLSFEDSGFDMPSREGLLNTISEACKQNTNWAFSLGRALVEQELWSSDLLTSLIQGLQESELFVGDWRELLTLVSEPMLQAVHTHKIAGLLFSLVRDGGKSFAIDLLEQANSISLSIWQTLAGHDHDTGRVDWLGAGLNQPEGVIVHFWINGLSLYLNSEAPTERVLPENYRSWFTMVVNDETSKGGIGRSILTSQTAFLFGLDEVWTLQHIVPLFSDPNPQKFSQAWNGYLMWGRLNPALSDVLLPAFIAAVPRLASELDERRRRFIEFYTAIAIFYVSDPTQTLLPTLFQYCSLEERFAFASNLESILRRMQPPAINQLWNSWLRRYWEGRLQGVLAPLDEMEVSKMLGWLPYLGDAFPNAVAFVLRSPVSRIEQSQIFHTLRSSELVILFPTQTAELLIYLAQCASGHQLRFLSIIEARLPLLPADTRRNLDEAFARAGVVKQSNSNL
ncbi:DUF4020 domain-containing protein [Enterobacter soli]|uniref:DUF4020 domain-containing protein n=1 Tax=Enterobacter soli TaxID=885040 RepID=UPI003ED8B47C